MSRIGHAPRAGRGYRGPSAAPRDTPAAPPVTDTPPSPHAAAPTVLVVDDAIADQDLHCLLLQRWGLRALAAGDGWEALAYARAVRPDAVVTDLEMPGLDGWGLLARLRAAPETAHVPVLLLSAHAAAVTADRAHAAGACAVLAKPLDRAALRAALERALPTRPLR